jgi:MoxR-like ATPase
MLKLKQVLEKVYETPSLRKSIVPLFIGNPGLGKTVLIEEFAKEKKVKLVELITSQMSPFEISGIAMPDKDDKKMKYYNFDKLENLKDGDILFFDELLNGNPVVLNACLTILEQRRFISGKPLPDIMIVAAANPQGMVPLTPQIKERFIWYTVTFDKDMWKEYMVKKYQMTKGIADKLANTIKKEEFTTNNFYTPRSIDKAVDMIINEVVTPYEDIVTPILSTLIKNPFKEPIQLSKEQTLAPSEMISWLDLIKLKNKK